ncbi:hypothetical protein HN873_012347 [Arachis hypogaea]
MVLTERYKEIWLRFQTGVLLAYAGYAFLAQDSEKGKGWKRFEFEKDAPLEDEEIEVAENDASLVKQIGQSFQYSKIEAKREEQIQAAHDEAMFGASSLPPPTSTDSEPKRENEKEVDKKAVVTSLLSETVSGFTADLCG